MNLLLEDLEYQNRVIKAVVGVFAGQIKNSFDNSNLFGIQANVSDLTPEQIEENKAPPRRQTEGILMWANVTNCWSSLRGSDRLSAPIVEGRER